MPPWGQPAYCAAKVHAAEADAARLAVQKLAEADRARGHHPVYGDGKIRRVWGLAGKDPIFRRLIQHPLVVAIWKRILGEDLIASSFTANIVGPGALAITSSGDRDPADHASSDRKQAAPVGVSLLLHQHLRLVTGGCGAQPLWAPAQCPGGAAG
jgi:hypothetical protein